MELLVRCLGANPVSGSPSLRFLRLCDGPTLPIGPLTGEPVIRRDAERAGGARTNRQVSRLDGLRSRILFGTTTNALWQRLLRNRWRAKVLLQNKRNRSQQSRL